MSLWMVGLGFSGSTHLVSKRYVQLLEDDVCGMGHVREGGGYCWGSDDLPITMVDALQWKSTSFFCAGVFLFYLTYTCILSFMLSFI